MKQIQILALTLVGVCSLSVTAEEINSEVIHNYKYVGAAYDYVYGDQTPDGHGGSVFASYELKNFLFGIGGGYLQAGDNPEFETTSVHGAIGYVLRLQENHINIIPSFGIGYSETKSTFRFPPFFVFENTTDSTVIAPGISLSYAFNNYFRVNAGYTYGYDLDTEDDGHLFSVGAECAVTKSVGLEVGTHFDSEEGFTGVSGGISFHF